MTTSDEAKEVYSLFFRRHVFRHNKVQAVETIYHNSISRLLQIPRAEVRENSSKERQILLHGSLPEGRQAGRLRLRGRGTAQRSF